MHTSNGILQELKMFVPKEDSIKVQILHLENKACKKKGNKTNILCKTSIG